MQIVRLLAAVLSHSTLVSNDQFCLIFFSTLSQIAFFFSNRPILRTQFSHRISIPLTLHLKSFTLSPSFGLLSLSLFQTVICSELLPFIRSRCSIFVHFVCPPDVCVSSSSLFRSFLSKSASKVQSSPDLISADTLFFFWPFFEDLFGDLLYARVCMNRLRTSSRLFGKCIRPSPPQPPPSLKVKKRVRPVFVVLVGRSSASSSSFFSLSRSSSSGHSLTAARALPWHHVWELLPKQFATKPSSSTHPPTFVNLLSIWVRSFISFPNDMEKKGKGAEKKSTGDVKLLLLLQRKFKSFSWKQSIVKQCFDTANDFRLSLDAKKRTQLSLSLAQTFGIARERKETQIDWLLTIGEATDSHTHTHTHIHSHPKTDGEVAVFDDYFECLLSTKIQYELRGSRWRGLGIIPIKAREERKDGWAY